ncbi:MAG: cytochrome P450, partial [Pseudomonadota bacterium]
MTTAANSDWPHPFSRSEDPHVDLSSLDAFNEGAPFATFERMRRDDPLAWTEGGEERGFWSFTRHEDILAFNRDTELLSSAKGIRLEDQS